jgi:hypothetical protein
MYQDNRICKDDELLFKTLEKAHYMKEVDACLQVQAAIQAFIQKPKDVLRKKIQAVAVSTDVARQNIVDFNVTLATDNFDLNYERVFKTVPLSQYQQGWQIYNVTNSLTFVKVAEGERIEAAGIKGTRTTAYVDKYGGAIGWTDELIRFNQIAAMVDMALIFRNKFWKNKADNHYALIAAAAAINAATAYDTVGTYQLSNDINTINKCAYDLSFRLKDKGYGNAADMPFLILANPSDEFRLEAAFRAATAPMSALGVIGAEVGRRKIDRLYTYNSSILPLHPIMVFPEWKLQRADAMQPTTFTAVKDPLTLNELQAVWAYYGAIAADTDQVQQFDMQ